MNDSALLSSYRETASQDAFARLVERHINLVYSIALRSTRDLHLAEDVTQAVFLVLAKRAGSIRDVELLPAWLMTTTRYAASNLRKQESRRRNREQRAAAMKSESYTPASPLESDVMPLLDEGLSALKPADRTAVILRYINGKTAREIGEDLRITEQTAQKRITRALEKIRAFLMRRGVNHPADMIASSLGDQYLRPAPAALVPLIVSRSFDAAATTTSVSVLADATIRTIAWIQAKAIATAACAACLLIAAGTAVVVSNSPTYARTDSVVVLLSPIAAGATAAPVEAGTTTIPANTVTAAPASESSDVLLLPNDTFLSVGNNSKDYELRLDAAVKRGEGPPALSLSSATAQKTSAGAAFRGADVAPFLGNRVRFSAYVKTNKPTGSVGLLLRTFDPAAVTQSFDDMRDRGITTTSDWKKLEIVADVQATATNITVGVQLRGSGEVWMDDARLEVVPADEPTTSEYRTHLHTPKAGTYFAALDPNVLRNGLPVMCISSSAKPTGTWCWYGPNQPPVDAYLGRRVRVSAWIKTENCTGSGARLSVWAWDPQNKLICIDNPVTRKLTKGTTDWKRYEIIADVPGSLQSLAPGFNLYGNGKVWIDELRYELVEDDSHL